MKKDFEMKVTFSIINDRDAIAYIRVKKDKVHKSLERREDGIILDLNKKGEIRGIEFLHPSLYNLKKMSELANSLEIPELSLISLDKIYKINRA